MFTPLTIAIFSGALSPSCLEGQSCISGRLQQAAWRLKSVTGALDELTGELRVILSDWQIELPLPSCDFLSFPYSPFADAEATAALSHVREAEMEYVLSVTYCEEQPLASYTFYDALLKAEARWLKLWLHDCIGRLRSVRHARLLLCRVLDEVYATGVLIDDACRCGLREGLCCQLKGSLASLYLMLTIDFGHLLQPADYKDYRTLLSDASYQHPICKGDALTYDILQSQNRVVKLFSDHHAATAASTYQAATRLYEQQSALFVALGEPFPTDERLCQGIVALENYLFLYLSKLPIREGNLYLQLIDRQWMNDCLNDLCEQQYGGHKSFIEARGASDWVGRRLNDSCLSFLHPKLLGECSIPRCLIGFLHRKERVYHDAFSQVFVPTLPEKQLTMVPSDSIGAGRPDVDEIHRYMAFLHQAKHNGKRWMTDEQADYLEESFITFLQQGTVNLTCCKKVKVLKDFSGVLYGLFFHYCELKGTRSKRECAQFLVTVIDADMQVDNLKKNAVRCIRCYKNYVAGKNSSASDDEE